MMTLTEEEEVVLMHIFDKYISKTKSGYDYQECLFASILETYDFYKKTEKRQ